MMGGLKKVARRLIPQVDSEIDWRVWMLGIGVSYDHGLSIGVLVGPLAIGLIW